MKQLALLIFLICPGLSVTAQNEHPVSWQFSTEQIAPLTYRIKLHATVRQPYHIYPQEAAGGMGQPTEIIFEAHNNVEYTGEILEKGDEHKDGETPAYYGKGVTFTQTIKLRSEDPTSIGFTIKYMACTNQMCLPPSKKQGTLAINHSENAYETSAGEKTPETLVTTNKTFQYENFSMADTDGKIVFTGDAVAKSKYTFIDFWASWCAPCRKQGRDLIPLYNKYKSKGFNVIGVSLDTDAAAWKKAIQADGYTWINLSDLKGFESPLSKKYNITAIPRNLLIDHNGQIIAADLHGKDLEAAIGKLFE